MHYSGKRYVFCLYTILLCGVGIYYDVNWFHLIVFYCFWLPFWCLWLLHGVEKSSDNDQSGGDAQQSVGNRQSDHPRFPYNCPIRSYYQAPDRTAAHQRMAEQALQLENYLEGPAVESSIDEDLMICKEDPFKKRVLCNLNSGCEICFEVELTVDIEHVIEIPKPEVERCTVDCSAQKNSDKDESSKGKDEEQKFSLDEVPLEFLYKTS